MSRRPSRRAVLAVRAVKAAATTAVAGAAVVLTLGGATATPAGSAWEDGALSQAEGEFLDVRCAAAAGMTIVRTPRGETRAVSFEQGWKVYQGERRGPWSSSAPTRCGGRAASASERRRDPRAGPPRTRTVRRPRARRRRATGCRARARPGAPRPRRGRAARGPRGGRGAGSPGAARRARGRAPRPPPRASPAGTTRSTSPMPCASAAPTGRPVRITSRAVGYRSAAAVARCRRR